jgi:hypothetical protein
VIGVYLNVTSVEAHERFFASTLGGAAATVGADQSSIVRFPNAFVSLRRQLPTGGTKGTTVNHFAFGVPDIRSALDRVKTAGYAVVTRAEVPPSQEVNDDLAYMADQQTFVAFMMAPDETKVEFIEIKAQRDGIALHHLHFATPQVPEMKTWYVQAFEAAPGKRGNFEAADLPGINLTYSPAAATVVGTRGRSLDRIGFEVKSLQSFRERVETMSPGGGIAPGGASVFVTDPWGTYIEVSEHLDKVS